MVKMLLVAGIAAFLCGSAGAEPIGVSSTNDVSLSVRISSFCGFPFGRIGTTKSKAEFSVKLAKPFRHFKEASLYYTDETFRLKTVDLRGKMPDVFSVNDGIEEVCALKRLVEKKYGITITDSRDDGFEYISEDVRIYCYMSKRDLDIQLTVTNMGAVRRAAQTVRPLTPDEGLDVL